MPQAGHCTSTALKITVVLFGTPFLPLFLAVMFLWRSFVRKCKIRLNRCQMAMKWRDKNNLKNNNKVRSTHQSRWSRWTYRTAQDSEMDQNFFPTPFNSILWTSTASRQVGLRKFPSEWLGMWRILILMKLMGSLVLRWRKRGGSTLQAAWVFES